VSAFDISAEAVRRTREVLASDGYADQCSVAQMGAERLDYADESFDVVFGFAILHHLDLKPAIAELYRVLKPGGIAYFAEHWELIQSLIYIEELRPSTERKTKSRWTWRHWRRSCPSLARSSIPIITLPHWRQLHSYICLSEEALFRCESPINAVR